MVLSNDLFWSYVEDMTGGGTKCKFCGHTFGARTSISRIKWHLSGVRGRGVEICGEVPKNVQEAAFLATEGADKRHKPSSSHYEVANPISNSSEGQHNGNANSIRDLERMLLEDSCTQQEGEEGWEERIFPGAEAGVQIENQTRETLRSIRGSVSPWRPLVDENETRITTIQTADIVGQATKRSWAEMFHLSNSDALQPLSRKMSCLESGSISEEVDAELKEWESRLQLIHAVIDDAEEKQLTNQAVEIWVSRLKHLAYDVEDILDEFETESLQSKLKSAESQASTSTVGVHFVACNKEAQSNLKNITARLDDLIKEKSMLNLHTSVGGMTNRVYHRLPTTESLPQVFHGREGDKKAILQMLMYDEPSHLPYSVIPITGMGGVGKTTLAQWIYNYDRLEFDCKAWVCVSDDFDVVKITKTILLNFGNCVKDDLNLLQRELKEKLLNKKFLIILDDVWSEDYDAWVALSIPFAAGAQGSKIIVTTRSQIVSSTMSSVPDPYKLKELSDDACLRILAQHALSAESFDARPDLKSVGQEIALRCKGIPLAATTLGGLLRVKKTRKEWEAVSKSKIWDLPVSKNILPALRLSYYYLPSYLKQCFAYCAIFPKDFEFHEDELVLLWMAEGFLAKNQSEDLGHEYFNDLLSRSFFQQSTQNKSRFVIHDLMSDLAQFVSRDVCFHLVHEQSSKSNVRHSAFMAHTFDIWKRFEVFYKMKRLRTFLAVSSSMPIGYCHLSRKVLDDLIPTLKYLRALSLAGYSVTKLPSSINALQHLRYLNMSNTSISMLPETLGELFNLQTLVLCRCRSLVRLPKTLGELFNLQTLILQRCCSLVRLPESICNLINLQHLDISGTDNLKETPPQLSKLIELRTLSKFIVGKKCGHGLRELMKLTRLQGKLHIIGLHNVEDVQDAMSANLREKQGLDELELEGIDNFNFSRKLEWIDNLDIFENEMEFDWIDNVNVSGNERELEWIDNFNVSGNERDLELEVLNLLQPHQNLKRLSITSYGGIRFPSWIGDGYFTEMVGLKLHNCRNITSLSSLVKLPALRHLSIKGMKVLKEMVMREFPSLKTLIIEDLLRWEQWSRPRDLKEEATEKFLKLRELTLINCPMIIGELPSCLPSLKKLHISSCSKLIDLPEKLPSLRELVVKNCQKKIFRNVWNFISLRRLEIKGISGLVNLHEILTGPLSALEDLMIGDCKELKYLWQDGFFSLVKGEEACLLCNLRVLSLSGCNNLEKLSDELHSLASLRELFIGSCDKLVSLSEGPGLPYSLKSLIIQNCDSLESLPDGMMTMIDGDNRNECLLEELILFSCPSLRSFPRGKMPPTLKKLEIVRCEKSEFEYSVLEGFVQYDDAREMSNLGELQLSEVSVISSPSLRKLKIGSFKQIESLSFPPNLSHLTELTIQECDGLVSFGDLEFPFPNLVSLGIYDCKRLRSLPNHMISLETLSINSCCSLEYFPKTGLPPKLTSLTVVKCENLRQPISKWRLHTLTSLKVLCIELRGPYCTRDMDYFPDNDGELLPTSLIHLFIINLENLKSISSGIQHLTSLESLRIDNCPNLHELPKDGFPSSLGYLQLYKCPLLKQGCLKKGGYYWHIISHIPKICIS